MAIGLDPDGDFLTLNGKLTVPVNADWQNYESEVRCLQGTYSVNQTFGRDPFIWGLSQSPKDRCSDLIRIGQKYTVVKGVDYDTASATYRIQG